MKATFMATTNATSGLGYISVGEKSSTAMSAPKGADELEVKLEFGGGLHLLFSNTPKRTVRLPRRVEDKPVDMRYLVRWMKDTLVSEREEMFGEGEGVRPGILVLINDADWELENELEYELQDGDCVVFISTLHGG